MQNKLTSNLNRLMVEAHLTSSELSRRTGIPIPTIKKIRHGENINPTLATLTPIAQHFSLTVSQLIGEVPFDHVPIKKTPFYPAAGFSQLPLITWSEAISWPATQTAEHEKIIAEYPFSDQAYALMVNEDHWQYFMRGTFLLVDPKALPLHLDFVLVHRDNTELPILRQFLIDDGIHYLKPMVQGYQMLTLTKEHRILGVVIEAKKYLKME